jgi:hypothetical protein
VRHRDDRALERVEALLERQTQALVECVVLNVGGGVVVGGGALDPVAVNTTMAAAFESRAARY